MKKIVLAFDSFKGSADAFQVTECVHRAIRSCWPSCEIVALPVADGGEGTTRIVGNALGARAVCCPAHDPCMRQIDAEYAVTPDGQTAIIETASASGLPLVPSSRRNPLETTTFGTGEMVLDALNRGCRHILLGLGGSATNDAGIGVLVALGVRFLGRDGCVLPPVGSSLNEICDIDESGLHPLAKEADFTLICDVDSPFYGERGAAYVFAPQKGADARTVEMLDEGLRHYASVLRRLKGIDISCMPGSGAAGGMGGGLLPFLRAGLRSGSEAIPEMLRFGEAIGGADLILTGEGKLDRQTCMGKALHGIVRLAREQSIPVIGLGGCVEDADRLDAEGFTAVLSVQTGAVGLEQAMCPDTALRNIGQTVVQVLRIVECFGNGQEARSK